MVATKKLSGGGSRLWLLVYTLGFLSLVNSYEIEEQTLGNSNNTGGKTRDENANAGYSFDSTRRSVESELKVEAAADDEFETRARTLAARVQQLYPECSTALAAAPRLPTAFEEIASAADGSTEFLVEAYGVLLDVILANANTSNGINCNGDYVELAYKVLEQDQKNAAEISSALDAGEKLQELKERFHPGVFKLFNETARFVLTAPDKFTDGYALYATQKAMYNYIGKKLTFSVIRRFDSRLPAFYWNLVSANKSDRSRNEFDFVSIAGSETKFRLSLGEGPLRLVPSSESLLNTKSELFQFRIAQSTSYQSRTFYQIEADGGSTHMLPPHLRNEIYVLYTVRWKPNEGSRFALVDMNDIAPEKSSNISDEVRSLYPLCRNEKDLLDKYRLHDFLKVYNNDTESAARLRAAYGALLDEILGSPFLCGQDYVQLAYHVLQRCGDGSATSDDAEQQAWNEFKGRFNPRVFDLFDEQKSWALMFANKPGFALDFDAGKRKDPMPWDKRQLRFAVSFVSRDQGRHFAAFSIIDKIRNKTSSGRLKKQTVFLPTSESVLPDAENLKFWVVTGGESQFTILTRLRLFRGFPNNIEPEECHGWGWDVNNLNCSVVFYFEDMKTNLNGSAEMLSVEEARKWYPPCDDEKNLLDDWRLWNFFEAFNAETKSSSVLVEAYNAMFDAITTNSPLICSQDYVQLAFKVQQIQQSLNISAEDQENWERLRSRFNPKVFDLFDENKTWRIASVKYPDYAILGSDRLTGDGWGIQSNLELLKVDSRFPAFNWRFQPLEEGRAFDVKSYLGLSFQWSLYGSEDSKPLKQQIVPSVSSLVANSTVFEFNIVQILEYRVHSIVPIKKRSKLPDRNKTFKMDYARRFKESDLFSLHPVYETAAPFADVSISEQVKELYPQCKTRQDDFTLDRLWDVFHVFHLNIANSSILIEAYEATLEAILAPSLFNCTANYVQLAYQIYELEKKLNRTNTSEDQLNEFERLKNRFNPGVFKLFDDQQMYRIMSVDQPGYVLYAWAWNARVNELSSRVVNRFAKLDDNRLVLRRIPTNESLPGYYEWSFNPFPRASSFQCLNADVHPSSLTSTFQFKKVFIVPVAATLDPMAPNFQFEIQYIDYLFRYERKVLSIAEPESQGQSSALGEIIFKLPVTPAKYFHGNTAKFTLEV